MEDGMALIEDVFKGNAVTGVAIGVAALVLGSTLLPTVGRVLRPAAKTVIKGGIMLYRETVTAIGELTTGLVEEAKRELEQSPPEHAAVAGSAPAAHRESSREKH
jgi:ABC-type uncharacterized transport system permease subunit